jgi:DNA polymerase-3 subunit beta
MKVAANAGVLSRALALAASLEGDKRYAALAAVNVSTVEGAVTLTRNVLEHQLKLTVPATIERPGSLAVPADQLHGLAAGFPAVAEITIEAAGSTARVRSGRSHYKLPVIPATTLPLELAVPANADGVELSRDQAVALFAPAFCAAHDGRTYICGVHIHGSDAGLVGCATNGYALNLRTLSGVTGWGSDITVPIGAIKTIGKLLAGKGIETVTLRHAKAKAALVSIETPTAVFVSKLVDGTYPDYGHIIPKPSGNTATVKLDALVPALTRLTAVGGTIVQLLWAEGALQLTADGDTVEDLVLAEIAGTGKVTLTVNRLMALLAEFKGKTATIEVADPATPIRILDRDDAGYLAVLAPVPGGPR